MHMTPTHTNVEAAMPLGTVPGLDYWPLTPRSHVAGLLLQLAHLPDQAQSKKQGPWSGVFTCAADLQLPFPADGQFGWFLHGNAAPSAYLVASADKYILI